MASSSNDDDQCAALYSDADIPADTVVLTDESLGRIAGCLGNVYFRLGLILHVPTPYINQLEHKFRDDLFRLNFEVLARWRDNNKHVPNMTKELIEALRSLDLNDVVETVRDEEVYQLKERVKLEQKQRKTCRENMRATKEELKQAKDELSQVKTKLLQAKATDGLQQSGASTTSPRVTNRNIRPTQRLLAVGGLVNEKEGENEKVYKQCDVWIQEKNCWRRYTELPPSVGKFYDVCQVANDQLLLTGGSKGGAKADCWLMDLTHNTWTQMPSMRTARFTHRSVLVGDNVYVVGGKDGSGSETRTVERFSLTKRQWSSQPDLPRPARNPAVTSHGHTVFVFGGREGPNKELTCTQSYNTVTGQWITLAEMHTGCNVCGVVSFGKYIYLVGGFKRICSRYNTATDSWEELNQPRQKHGNAPAVVWEGGILVAGGGGPNSKSNAVEYYDPLTDEWADWETPLNEKLNNHRLFSVIVSGV